MSYSGILKLETLKKDTDWLFDKLNIQHLRADWERLAAIDKSDEDDVETGHGGLGGKGGLSRNKVVQQYFSQLSKENITRLYQKFQVDFEMFGYENKVQKFIDMGL